MITYIQTNKFLSSNDAARVKTWATTEINVCFYVWEINSLPDLPAERNGKCWTQHKMRVPAGTGVGWPRGNRLDGGRAHFPRALKTSSYKNVLLVAQGEVVGVAWPVLGVQRRKIPPVFWPGAQESVVGRKKTRRLRYPLKKEQKEGSPKSLYPHLLLIPKSCMSRIVQKYLSWNEVIWTKTRAASQGVEFADQAS